jgi:hypothetical protein
LENLSDSEDINRAWKNIKGIIKTSGEDGLDVHELKQHKPWFDEECLHFLDQRKQDKMQWVQDTKQSNVDNLNNVQCGAGRHFRNKKKAYLKAKIDELETNSKIKNIRDLYRGINNFKKGYQPRSNIVKDDKSDLVADCHSILARWRNHFSQLLNILGVYDIRQTGPTTCEVKPALAKLRSHKSPDTEQIPTELITAGGRTTSSEIHRFINSIWNKEELPEQWKELDIFPVYKMGEETDWAHYFCQT